MLFVRPEVQKKVIQNLIPGLIQICTEFDDEALFFYFRAEISCLIELGSKIQS